MTEPTLNTAATSTRALADALFRHRTVFLLTALGILVLTLLLTLVTPRTYQSDMNILVRNARPDYLISPQANTGQVIQRDVTEERINSEIEILRSRDVADAVVDPTWSSLSITARTPDQLKSHEKAVQLFTKHLTVELLRKTNVIHVTYAASSPELATDTNQRVLAAFLARQREIERSTGASGFFAAQATQYKQQLDQAQQQLAAYQQTNQIVSLPTRETTLETQASELEATLRDTEVQLSEAERRVASDKHELAQLPPRLNTQQRLIPSTQAVEQLVSTLNDLQIKHTFLLTRFQPTDPLLTENELQIRTTTASLTQARATHGEESTTDVNPIYQQVRGVLTASTTDLAALRGRLASQTAQLAHLRQQLALVEGGAVDFTTLQDHVTELAANYQLYTQKKNEAEIADSMDQHQLVNVAIAENPTFSARPASPRIWMNLALGVFSALFLAALAVFFAEMGRDTINSPAELEAISTAPVLATIPFVNLVIAPPDRLPPTPPRSTRTYLAPDPKPIAIVPSPSLAYSRSAIEAGITSGSKPPSPPTPHAFEADTPSMRSPINPIAPVNVNDPQPRDPMARPHLPPRNPNHPARLSPSQRTQRRPVPTHDQNGRLAYVTYTVEPIPEPQPVKLPNAS